MPAQTIEQTFAQAVEHHRAGRLHDAESLYRQVLARGSGNSDSVVGACINLGVVLRTKGARDEAIAAYQKAIALRPGYFQTHHNLGIVLQESGRLTEAVAAYEQAIALNPRFCEAPYNLGIALAEMRKPDEAIAAYRQAIAIVPNYPEAHNNLGNVLKDAGQLDEAITAYRQAVALKPDYCDALNNLGNALKDKGQIDQAIAAYRRAMTANVAQAHSNLVIALLEKGQPDDAVAAARQAIAVGPGSTDAHNALGLALMDKGQLDDAAVAFGQSIALKPDLAKAHFHLSTALLRRGDFAPAWDEYEWRWKVPGFTSPQRDFTQPRWRGENLAGRTILLHAEQGMGDTMLSLRYVPMVAKFGGKVVVEVHRELHCLARSLPGVDQCIVRRESLPDFDVHCPIMSLPLAFGTTLATIPPPVAFPLDPQRVQKWRSRLEHEPPGLKVALNWAGNPTFKDDATRSLTLDRLASLAGIPGVTFYSIQKGVAATQAQESPAGLRLVNLSPEIDDFADTAAIMSLMDVVLTTDTSVAHLAGTQGRRTWVMLQFAAEWRWLMDRTDSPWYPNMRLFRQSSLGDWPGVIRRVAEELGKLQVAQAS